MTRRHRALDATYNGLYHGRRYGRAMHRAIRRHRARVIAQGLRFVAADDPTYFHANGLAYPVGWVRRPIPEDVIRYTRDQLASLPPREG